MELEQLAHLLEQQAREVQSELKELQLSDLSPATGSAEPLESVLSRIERRLTVVGNHTERLLQRIPHDFESLIGQINDTHRQQSNSVSPKPTNSTGGYHSRESTTDRLSANHAIASLTPVEQKVFRICFDGGFFTYRQIAERLDVVPTTAKNIVNRLFKDENKRRLFCKRQVHGVAQVALNEAVRERILGAQAGQWCEDGHEAQQSITLGDCP
jgi:DNA-directed RNA polymerase specialized sigma24 family protein